MTYHLGHTQNHVTSPHLSGAAGVGLHGSTQLRGLLARAADPERQRLRRVL